MMPLQRHRLAYLSQAGWAAVRARAWDAQAQACIDHWAAHRLPLVVTRQPPPGEATADAPIALGLPAPLQWERRRLSLQVPSEALSWFDEFPLATQATAMLPRSARVAWRGLCAALADSQASARVYGGYGWQQITGLDYVHAGSDLDLWVRVNDAAQADQVAALLAGLTPETFTGPRLDGELVFPDGTAVAWREWRAWRAGRARGLLLKRLHGAAMADAAFVARWQGVPEMAA